MDDNKNSEFVKEIINQNNDINLNNQKIDESINLATLQDENIIDSGNDFQSDIDCVDFKWFPTSKDETITQKNKNDIDKNMEIPKKVQKSLIKKYEFPKVRINSAEYPIFIHQKFGWKLIIGAICITSLLMINWLIFMGFIFGAGTCYIIIKYCGVYNYNFQKDVLSLPRLKDLQSPGIPHILENNEDLDLYSSNKSTYSCWINMIGVYNIDKYNINHCNVVYIDIEDKLLRIRRTKKKINHRTIGSDICYQDLSFISEVTIDMTDAKIDLRPTGLVLKRLWSKKYPICINFPKILGDCISDVCFSDILNYKCQEIYFFGRTCRDKEELFRRLLNACNVTPTDLNIWNIVKQHLTKSNNGYQRQTFNISNKIIVEDGSHESTKNVKCHQNNKDKKDQELYTEGSHWEMIAHIPQIAEYVKFMAKFMPSDMFLLTSEVMSLDINYVTCCPEIQCLNSFLGRIFWDFLYGSHWVDIIKNKVQCKLKKIHLPQILDELSVVDINIGKEIPLIRKLGRPYLDSKGLWFDIHIAYTGGFSMTIETKVNLFNLRNQIKRMKVDEDKMSNHSTILNNDLSSKYIKNDIKRSSNTQNKRNIIDKNAAFFSSEEDSPESSSYSEDSGDESKFRKSDSSVNVSGNESFKRPVCLADKIAQSPYFKRASDNKFIQRGMEIVSNTKLILQVELNCISGTLAINMPPPPSDRLWYGFRQSPIIKLSAKPKVGETEISITKITDLIEKKLLVEFQRVIVMPNMDDIPMPLLVNGNLKNYTENLS